jgi:ligand-binding sensor domain-containing protein
MKTIIKILCLLILFNVALSEWELRTNLDFVRQFATDGKKMYLGRNNGLTVYDLTTKASENKTSINSELPGNYINTLMPMPDKTILISTNGGLAVIENGTLTTDKPICRDYPDNDARDLYKDSSGNIWTFSTHKVHKYSNGTWKTYNLSDSIRYAFDISRLFFHKNQVWALFNDNTQTSMVYYFSSSDYERIKIAVLADSGIVKLFQSRDEFPYYDGYSNVSISLASANDDVYLKNPDSIYVYHDTTWSMTNIFFIGSFKPNYYSDLYEDNNNNLWCIISDDMNNAHPASYNINTGNTTEHLKEENENYIADMTILDDGTVVAYTGSNFYFYNDTGWTKYNAKQFGIPDGVSFADLSMINGKKYVVFN